MNSWSWAPMQTSNSAYGNFPINRKASDTNVNEDSNSNSSNTMGQQNQNQYQLQQQQQQQSPFMQFSQPQAQEGGGQNNYQTPSTPANNIGPHHTHTFENMTGGIQNYPGHVHPSQQPNQNQNQSQEAQIEYLTGKEAMDVLKKIDPNYEYMYQFPPGSGQTKKQHHHHHQQQQQQQQQQEGTTQNMMPMEIGSGESPHNYQQQQQQQQQTNRSVKVSNNNSEAKNVAFASDVNTGASTRSKKQLSKSKSHGGGIRQQPPRYLQSFYQVPPLVRPNANAPNVHPQHPQITSSQMKRMVNKPSYKLCGKCPKCKTLQGPPTTNIVNFNINSNNSNKNFRGGLASAYSSGNLVQNRFTGGGALGRGHSATLFPR